MDTVSGFFQQEFVSAALAMMCFFGALLIALIAALVYIRRHKAQQRLSQPAATPSVDHDLPDLDRLVGTAAFAEPPVTSPPVTPESARVSPPPTAPVRTVPKGTYSLSLADGSTAEAVEVLAILRDVEDGKLIVQIGDKAYRNLNADAAFKERVTKILRELAQIASAKPSADSTPVPASPATEPAQPADTAPPQEVKPAAPKPASPPPPLSPAGEMPGDLPRFSIDEPLQKIKRGQKREAKPVPEINIAGAIEAYLQHKLRHTPEYSSRSIHIYPAPDGGVNIEVDGRFFDSVGDVSDAEIREFLAATIQEWQDRH